MSDRFLWSGLGLVAPLYARVGGTLPPGVTGISIDTRTLQPGEIFFALAGDARDGHAFVPAAFAAGAAAAVVDEAHAAQFRGAPCLYIVHDVLASLCGLAEAARQRSPARIVAITGSVGKTSTKDALRSVLARAGETHAAVASYNNHWGVPLTLARMPASARFGVFEIGMNHAGEITPLVAMVRPKVAVITTVAPVHLENFASIEGIADAKAEIFSGLAEGGTAILHRDIDTFGRLMGAAERSRAGRVYTFGESEGAEARLVSLALGPEGSAVEADIHGRRIAYRLAAPGRHLAVNSLAVLLAAEAAGMPLEEAAAALAGVVPSKGRGARSRHPVGEGSFTLIDESYNANPTSMRAALALLGATQPGPGGRRIAVVGDMLELGPEAEALHEGLSPDVEAAAVDLLFAAGPLSRALYDAVPEARRGLWAPTAAGIEAPVADAIRAGDVVMIKGSNGSRMGPIVTALKDRFALAHEAP